MEVFITAVNKLIIIFFTGFDWLLCEEKGYH